MRVDVVCRRVVRRAAPYICLSLSLVNAHIVDVHLVGERERRGVDGLERTYARRMSAIRMPIKLKNDGGYALEIAKFRTIDIGSSGTSRRPTPLPSGRGSSVTALAPMRTEGTPFAIQVM